MPKLLSFFDAEIKRSAFELLRVGILGGISAMLIELSQWQPPTTEHVILVLLGTAILKSLDEYIRNKFTYKRIFGTVFGRR